MVTIYGIGTCDSCRAAKKALEGAARAVTVHDVRKLPLDKAELKRFHAVFGDALLNRKSTTWRGLAQAERDGDPLDLLFAHPTLMKRPVVEQGDILTLGWGAAQAEQHLG